MAESTKTPRIRKPHSLTKLTFPQRQELVKKALEMAQQKGDFSGITAMTEMERLFAANTAPAKK